MREARAGRAVAGGAPVSVVIPVHNRSELLQRALASVAAQRPEPPAEVIVVDDASTDGSAEQAERAGAMVVRSEVNLGPGPARNVGLHQASQPWCAFLDSDDVWAEDHLATLLAEANDATGLVASTAIMVLPGGVRVAANPYRAQQRLRAAEDVLAPESVITTSACMVRTGLALEVGGFGEARVVEDLDLWLRIVDAGGGCVLPQITVRYGPAVAGDGRAQASADLVAMRHHARTLVDAHPGLGLVAREAAVTCIAWDTSRSMIRDGHPVAAARVGKPLLHPRRWHTLALLLRHRRSLRTRWRDQPAAVARLVEGRNG